MNTEFADQSFPYIHGSVNYTFYMGVLWDEPLWSSTTRGRTDGTSQFSLL